MAAGAVEAKEGLALLLGGNDNAVADLGLDGLDQDQRENGGGQEKVHGGERQVQREGGGTDGWNGALASGSVRLYGRSIDRSNRSNIKYCTQNWLVKR